MVSALLRVSAKGEYYCYPAVSRFFTVVWYKSWSKRTTYHYLSKILGINLHIVTQYVTKLADPSTTMAVAMEFTVKLDAYRRLLGLLLMI